MSRVTYDTANFTVTVDDRGVAAALGTLRHKTPAVLKFAINKAARQARRDIIAASAARYDLTARGKEKVKRLSVKKKATNKSLSATIAQDDKGLPLDFAYFRHSPTMVFKGAAVVNAPEHVKGRVLKGTAMQDLTAGAGRSKGFLVEFKSGHIGMVQRIIGVRAKKDTTERGYRRWEPNELLKTMNRPGASGMGKAVWNLGVDQRTADNLEKFVEQRLKQVIAKG